MSTCKNTKAVQFVGVEWDSSRRCYTVTTWYLAADGRMYDQISYLSVTDAIDTFTAAVKSMIQDNDLPNCITATCSKRNWRVTTSTTTHP